MSITRIESITYGVEDLDTGMRYYDDWGVQRLDHGTKGADYRLPSGQTIKLRSASDPSLPPPTEPGSTARELVWGVDNAAGLDQLGATLSRDQKITRDADTTIHVTDPFGM